MRAVFNEGGIAIWHGDCRELIPITPPETVDLVLTDPPYGMSLDTDNTGTGGTTRDGRVVQSGRKWDRRVEGDDQPFDPEPLLKYRRLILWGGNHFASRLPESNGWIVWNKRGDGQPSGMHFGDCELAWTNVAQGIRMFSNVWHGAPRWRAEPVLHPTQKPVTLMRWLVEQFTEPGQLVFDPYMGSGPVAEACRDLGRRYIGCEIVEGYCRAAVVRLAQGTLEAA